MKAFLAFALAILATAPAALALPVFPGAVGFGTNTKAGRDADINHIYKVTTLDDDFDNPPNGSLRYGIEKLTGPRVIVFDVSGVIELRGDLFINPTTSNPTVDHGYLTIAGQTAPFPGVTLKNGGIRIYSHDVLIQHIAIRPGALVTSASGWHLTSINDRDCVGTKGGGVVNNIVIDHVTCSWATDEMATTWWDSVNHIGTHTNITFSNNIFAYPISDAGHTGTEGHGFGMLVGPGSSNVSIVRNVMAFAESRNPLIRAQTKGAQVVNNFIYRPGANRTGVMYVGYIDSPLPPGFETKVSAIGNLAYLMRSREWHGSTNDAHQEGFYVHQDANPLLSLYLEGNYTYQPDIPGPSAFQPLSDDIDDQYSSPFYYGRPTTGANREPEDPYKNSGGTTWSPILGPPEYLKWKIVPGAGKFSGQRDFYDAELMRQINDPDDDSAWLYSQSELNGGQDPWAPVNLQNQPTFTVPPNPTLDDDGDGYTNLEEELHRRAAFVEGRSVATSPAVSKFDTFSDGYSEGWTTVFPGAGGSWAVSSSTFVQSALNQNSRATLNDSNWTDQVVEAKVDVAQFNGTSFVALYARFKSVDDAYYMTLRNTGAVELKRIKGGAVTTYATAGTYDPLLPHVLRLEVVGNSLRGFVDNVAVLSGTDSEWGIDSGQAGIGAFQANVAFDNVIASPFTQGSRVTDDFDDHNVTDWSMAETGASSWSTARVTTGSENWLLNQALTTGNHRAVRAVTGRDQSTQARVRVVTASDPKAFIAVYARYQDVSNGYYALLRNSPRTLELKKIVGGSTVVTMGTLALPDNFDLAAWHTLRLDASGDKLTTLKAYLDGQLQLVGSDVDSPFISGSAALGAYLTSAQFDDVVISQP